MRIAVCGGRHYGDWKRFNALLDAIHRQNGISAIIQGGASGADMLGRAWATNNDVLVETYAATWSDIDHPEAHVKYRDDGTAYDAFAGFRRNQEMLDQGKPDLTIGFPGDNGTFDMMSRSVRAQVATLKVNSLDDELVLTFQDDDIDEGESTSWKSMEWLLPPNPNKPKQPRRAAATPEGTYEPIF
jgi:hypothetical protein